MASGSVSRVSGGSVAGSWSFAGSGAAGSVTFTPASPLTDGSYVATITQRDSVGNLASSTVNFSVLLPAIPDFGATVVAGGAPLITTFTDRSQNAVSWLWDFGDGSTSTSANPVHSYMEAGTYTVTLTVANSAGVSASLRKDAYINVQQCASPVRILRQQPAYFPTLSAAYLSAASGETIEMAAGVFSEDLTIDRSVTIDGGFDCSFTAKTGISTINGNLYTTEGVSTLSDVMIGQ